MKSRGNSIYTIPKGIWTGINKHPSTQQHVHVHITFYINYDIMPYKKRHHMSKVARSKTHRCSLAMQERKVSSAAYCRTSGRRGELEVVVNSCCGVNLWLWHGFPTAAGKGFFQAGSYTMR